MKSTKKTWIKFRRLLLFLFIIYLINYFQVESGNYIDEYREKTILTEQSIKEFEKDVQNGQYVDIKDYTTNNNVDTSTPITDLGYNIGCQVDNLLNEKVAKFFNYIGGFFK